MKDVNFRPLRRRKKDGKIVVVSYMTWRKIATSDYGKFKLIVDNEYRNLPHDEFVHNHKGELLFFYQYNPNDIPVVDCKVGYQAAKDIYGYNFGLDYRESVYYNVKGMDCDGVPTFSHFTADYLATH